MFRLSMNGSVTSIVMYIYQKCKAAVVSISKPSLLCTELSTLTLICTVAQIPQKGSY